jgi:uncharacterized protein
MASGIVGMGRQAFRLLVPLWLIVAAPALAQNFPELTSRVVDEADLLSASVEADLTERLAAEEAATTNQIVVVTLPDLGGYDIADYGYQLGRHWGIGQEGKDNGALLIVSRDDRKIRIEVGYGLEGSLTDANSKLIIENVIVPAFKAGDFEKGIADGVAAVLALVNEGELPADIAESGLATDESGDLPEWAILPIIVIFALVLIFFLFFAKGGGTGGTGRSGRSWSSGGGGFSGGSGGGFSGGGGSFGGGGASGGW